MRNIWTYQMFPLSVFHPVSLALSQGVIILNGAPCYAISAVKHQRKWIIENMIFWSGGVKESFSSSCCTEPCSTLIRGQPQPQPDPESQTPHHYAALLYSMLRHLATQTPSQISETLLFFLSPLHTDIADNLFQKTASIWHSREQEKKKREGKKGMYI